MRGPVGLPEAEQGDGRSASVEKHAHRVVGVRRVTRGRLVSQVLRAAGQHDDSCRAEETPCLLVLPRVSPPDPTSTAVLRTLPGHQGLCPALAELARVSLRESPPPPRPRTGLGMKPYPRCVSGCPTKAAMVAVIILQARGCSGPMASDRLSQGTSQMQQTLCVMALCIHGLGTTGLRGP